MFTCVRFLFWLPFFNRHFLPLVLSCLAISKIEMQYNVELSMQLCQQLPKQVFARFIQLSLERRSSAKFDSAGRHSQRELVDGRSDNVGQTNVSARNDDWRETFDCREHQDQD